MLGACRLAGHATWAAVPTIELIAMYVLLAAVLLLGAAVIVWAARRYKQPGPEQFSAEEELARFRALRDRGELSAEEFERVRSLLEPPGGPRQQER
jgi:hypothetical protein